MENASKALIIAGAILLSILLITLGIMVYRQAAGVMDKNAMDETAVTTFNEKFLQYEGENVRGIQVNSLLSTIRQNNLSNAGDRSKQIAVTFETGVSDTNTTATNTVISTTTATPKALTGKSYKVKFENDPKSGYIKSVTIELLDK